MLERYLNACITKTIIIIIVLYEGKCVDTIILRNIEFYQLPSVLGTQKLILNTDIYFERRINFTHPGKQNC